MKKEIILVGIKNLQPLGEAGENWWRDFGAAMKAHRSRYADREAEIRRRMQQIRDQIISGS